ncbi:MAG: LL-diaminopimelate aminotransferase, partial [Deltaproteobacteria bacterium]|nr:LL-diaminopimelate aminotransferase [Deltaproteobacteria bacterium]
MQAADRLTKIPPYLFVTLRNKINKARAEGVDVINLGVGDPVDPTP